MPAEYIPFTAATDRLSRAVAVAAGGNPGDHVPFVLVYRTDRSDGICGVGVLAAAIDDENYVTRLLLHAADHTLSPDNQHI